MSGFEVLEALRSGSATRDIPVVVCTSRILTDQERVQLEARTAAIFSKEGYGEGQIAAVIRRVLRPRDLPAAI
jgi:CheY-like chemotaxis protein